MADKRHLQCVCHLLAAAKWLTDLRASKKPVDDKLAPSELKLLQNMEKEAEKIQENTFVYIDPKDIDKTGRLPSAFHLCLLEK